MSKDKTNQRFIKENWGFDKKFYEHYGRKLYGIVCPICNKVSVRYFWDVSNDKPFKCFLRHIECKIRLTGSIGHMRLFIKLKGIEAKDKLKLFAKKNAIIGIQINDFIKNELS